MKKKVRIDQLLVKKGLVTSRALAQRIVMAGDVRANGQVVMKSSSKVQEDAQITIVEKPKFVSRGGDKLEAALTNFKLTIDGRVCADVGASTGGFTDCLLQHGATHVYAIDVGRGIIHWKLRKDTRVTVMEKTNARYLKALPEPVSLITIDASFISLRVLLPVVKQWFGEGTGDVIALIKPQFEAGRKEAARGKGVIRDEQIHRRVVIDVLAYSEEEGYRVDGVIRSPVIGPKGNIEFLVWLAYPHRSSEVRRTWMEQVDILFPVQDEEDG